jgi:hypothetical protein
MFILAGMGAIFGMSTTMTRWESKALPLVISGLVFILAAVELSRELRRESKVKEVTEEGESVEEGIQVGRIFSGLGWVMGSALSCYVFGFLLTSLLFLFFFLKSRKRRWTVAIATAVIATVCVYAIFELGLGSELYRGVIYEAITSSD